MVDDDLPFCEENNMFAPENSDDTSEDKWKMLVVDDAEEIHQVTQFALSDFNYQGKKLNILSAYSAKEAEQLIQQHADIAVILLDVVMETDDAGLQFVKFVRESLKNQFVRIILRTGQPGYAPEKEVINRYQINDYKNKTELTDEKLFTILTAGLRSYTDILTIESLRQHLEDKVAVRTQELQQKNDELVQLTAQLKQRNDELTQLTEEKTQFLAIAAQNIRNPLESIQELSILIQRSFEKFPKAKITEFVRIIEVSSQRMYELISNLLKVNELETGKIDVSGGVFDIRPSLQFLADDYLDLAVAKDIKLKIELPTETCKIYVNKSALLQILDHLISNAIKYSPHGKQVLVRFQKIGELMRCEVQDQGPGLTVSEQQKLFGKFSRLSPRPTGDEYATGLGLYIVKKLVETMNGQVWCESQPGEGATFIVEFPITTQ